MLQNTAPFWSKLLGLYRAGTRRGNVFFTTQIKPERSLCYFIFDKCVGFCDLRICKLKIYNTDIYQAALRSLFANCFCDSIGHLVRQNLNTSYSSLNPLIPAINMITVSLP